MEINALRKARNDMGRFYSSGLSNHEENNGDFRIWARQNVINKINDEHHGRDRKMSLNQAIDFASELCKLIYSGCREVSHKVIDILVERMNERSGDGDEVDGFLGNRLSEVTTFVYEAEMYVRSLYLTLKSDGMEKISRDGMGNDIWCPLMLVVGNNICMPVLLDSYFRGSI